MPSPNETNQQPPQEANPRGPQVIHVFLQHYDLSDSEGRSDYIVGTVNGPLIDETGGNPTVEGAIRQFRTMIISSAVEIIWSAPTYMAKQMEAEVSNARLNGISTEAGYRTPSEEMQRDIIAALAEQGIEAKTHEEPDKVRGTSSQSEQKQKEIDLDDAWNKQVKILLELGVDKALGYETPEDYVATLPKFSPKSAEFGDRFNETPILIDPRLSWQDLLKLAGIPYGLSRDEINDWPGNNFSTPDAPYSIYAETRNAKQLREVVDEKLVGAEEAQEGDYPTPAEFRRIRELMRDSSGATSVPIIRKYLRPDERGSTAIESIFYLLYHPDFFENGYPQLLMVGSQELEIPRDPNSEVRLYLGRYAAFDGKVSLVDNHDPAANSANPESVALVVART